MSLLNSVYKVCSKKIEKGSKQSRMFYDTGGVVRFSSSITSSFWLANRNEKGV